MKAATQHQINFGGRLVEYRLFRSRAARKLRLRVGPGGVEVVQPAGRRSEEVSAFLNRNEAWILNQLQRVERLRSVRRLIQPRVGEILLRGEPTKVRVDMTDTRARGNVVAMAGCEIVVWRGTASQTPVARSLENWLRRQARAAIEEHLAAVTARIRQSPRGVYVMGQRTKWGNCSARRNLSFNWRLILAPDFVLRYLVTHEAVHLAVPDHSAKFWLTVRGLCPETESAKQWLRRNESRLTINLSRVVSNQTVRRRNGELAVSSPG